jgi:uracil permease
MPAHESATDYAFRPKDSLVGAQMLFVAFGALVLVPLLTGLNPNVALFTAGAGTLIFQFITKRMVPIFLASSFAFIAPIIHGVNTWGIPGTMCGLAAAGLLYVVLSLCIKTFGAGFLHRLLPPVVVGPVIMVIGLVLAPVAVHMAMGRTGDGAAWLVPQSTAMIVAGTALFVTVITSLLGKGWFRLIPILIGIGAGYVAALILDLIGISGSIQSGFDPGALKNFTGPALVSFKPLIDAPWFAVPDFVFPEWNLQAIIFIVPVAIAPAIEHFGDILAIGSVTGKDFVKEPGIHRTMMGDGIATLFCIPFRRTAQHHLQRGDRGGDPDPHVQPRDHDLGRHFRHRPGLCREDGCPAPDRPCAGDGRDHAPAVRCHHRDRSQHPGQSR